MVYEKVADILAEILNLDIEDITSNLALTKESDIEGIHIAKLIIECEKAFKIVIWDEDVHNFKVVGDIVKYINKAMEDSEGNTKEISDEERTAWYYN